MCGTKDPVIVQCRSNALSFNKYSKKCYFPAISHASAYCIRKICVKSKSWSKRKRIISKESHCKTTYSRCYCSRHKNCIRIHS